MKNGPYELVIAPDNYPGKKYRNRYCYEHHVVYWKNTSKLPNKDEIVHHKNGDYRDNRIENLELLFKKDHDKMHSLKGRTVVLFKCPNCNKEFEREKRNSSLCVGKNTNITCCSKRCSGVYSHKTDKEKEKLIKENVIKTYKTNIGDYNIGRNNETL